MLALGKLMLDLPGAFGILRCCFNLSERRRVKKNACLMLLALLATCGAAAGPGIHQVESQARRGYRTGAESHPQSAVRNPQSAVIGWGPLVPRLDTSITRQVYGYLPYWATQSHLHFDLLTAIGLFDVTLEPDGRISNYSGFPQVFAATIARAHRDGVRCEVVATCFGWYNIHQAITVGSDSAIVSLVALAESTGTDGINMDFEDILGSDRDTMVRFMRRLSAACRAHGLTLTMATMPLDFQNAYDFAALADTTDGLFMMEYNFHWPGCPEAGPTAPLFGWDFYGNLQGSLAQYLGAIGNGRKLLFGMPYYGYDWPTLADTTHARTSGTGADLYYVNARPRAQQHGRRWDAEGSVPWYSYDSGGWRQGWYDDDSSLMLKYQEVYEHDLLGTGMWALGYDGARTELWAALRESYNRPVPGLLNGDCETWQSDTGVVPSDTSFQPSGWYDGRRARMRRESNMVHGGSRALRHFPDSLGDSWSVLSMIFQDVQVVAGTSYEFEAWAHKRESLGNRMKLCIQWFNSSHTIIREDSSPSLVGDTLNWVQLSTGAVTAPNGAVFARLGLSILGLGGYDLWDDISFTNLTSVEEECSTPYAPRTTSEPTIVRGVLEIGPQPAASGSQPRIRLLDISGRKVMALHPGPNDVSRLAPGIYFMRTVSSDGQPANTKVVVTR